METPSIHDLVERYYEIEKQKLPLFDLVCSSVNVIQEAFDKYGIQPLAVSYNGGKDSDVCAHLWRLSLFLYLAQRNRTDEYFSTVRKCCFIVFHNPFDFEEITDHLQRISAAIGVHTAHEHRSFKEGLTSLIEQYHLEAIILGVRDTDPQGVGLTPFSPSTPDFPPFMRVLPLIHWTYGDVWSFIHSFSIPYCKLYNEGWG